MSESSPRGGSPSAQKLDHLVAALEVVTAGQQQVLTNQATTAVKFEALAKTVDRLVTLVMDGNGTPGLMQRVATLEAQRHADRGILQNVMLQLELIEKGIEAANELARQRAEAELADERKSGEDHAAARRGIWIAIAIAALSFLGTIITAALPLLLHK